MFDFLKSSKSEINDLKIRVEELEEFSDKIIAAVVKWIGELKERVEKVEKEMKNVTSND